MHSLRIAMAQMNATVGDLDGNYKKIVRLVEDAKDRRSDLIVFPELAITGYPPEDLLLKPQFIDGNIGCIEKIAAKVGGITAIIGFVDKKEDIFNAAAVIHNRKIATVYHKMFLPNYGVFDEERYFRSGTTPVNIVLGEIIIGLGICEDIWYPDGPARVQSLAGAQVIVNINASPYHMGKAHLREEILATRATDNCAIIVYNNLVGGQDELVFDGHGMVLNEEGEVIARGKAFCEDLLITDLDIEAVFRKRLHDPRWRKEKEAAEARVEEIVLSGGKTKTKRRTKPVTPRGTTQLSLIEEVYLALTTGTKDYVLKNGFRHVLIGLSGGIDSSLVAAIAVAALGKEHVSGVFMPSQYTSKESEEDAMALADNLGIEIYTIPMEEIFKSYLRTLDRVFTGLKPNVTEENIQARIRGNILMALSNKFGWLVLTTGNKSEMSVGYATLYGDMAGGFAVIKDLPKTMVYNLAEHINNVQNTELIPSRVLTKEPSAELKPDQRDRDTLPPYDVLDQILKAYIEEDMDLPGILAKGFEREIVIKVIKMVDASEYKRRQAPPGIKITPRAFGKDRRMPITNRYESY